MDLATLNFHEEETLDTDSQKIVIEHLTAQKKMKTDTDNDKGGIKVIKKQNGKLTYNRNKTIKVNEEFHRELYHSDIQRRN